MNNKIIAALVALIIIVAGVGAYCIISGNDESEDKHLLADDYALQIYGNANGDWAVDEKDIEYADGGRSCRLGRLLLERPGLRTGRGDSGQGVAAACR